MKTRTDTLLLTLAVLFVAGLAIVAGAISFAHMRQLATRHDQLGWQSYAFPISVDGLEIVASLCLVAQRRAGRSTGPIPWVALIVGTAASLTANIAVGGADLIGKALAGWPAVSMLISVKLLFSMFDHETNKHRTAVPDDQRTPPAVPRTALDYATLSRTSTDERTNTSAPSITGPITQRIDPPPSQPGTHNDTTPAHTSDLDDRVAALDLRPVAHLIPAARAARVILARDGRSLSRNNLADVLRHDGHSVSNERASLLLKILKTEQDMTRINPMPVRPHPENLDSVPEVAA